jgi:hypothetical protein
VSTNKVVFSVALTVIVSVYDVCVLAAISGVIYTPARLYWLGLIVSMSAEGITSVYFHFVLPSELRGTESRKLYRATYTFECMSVRMNRYLGGNGGVPE